jgi:hypothetical protein
MRGSPERSDEARRAPRYRLTVSKVATPAGRQDCQERRRRGGRFEGGEMGERRVGGRVVRGRIFGNEIGKVDGGDVLSSKNILVL